MDNTWTFASRIDPAVAEHAHETLELGWFLEGDGISDDYTPGEITAVELFSRWLEKIGDVEDMRISWWIPNLRELAPFTGADVDFLTHYSWPVHAETGEKLNWLTLPVIGKGWNSLQRDKGGFVQEVTGWKPSPLQRSVHIPTLLKASGWS